jgi:HTH-type transcriptional regulator, transcriptional repressor of NAD biosynthesis genes
MKRGTGPMNAARHPTGLIVGRFCPPHLGHSHLIESAADQVDQLVVYVNTRDDEVVPGELRAGWLAELHPDVSVVEVRHDLPTDFGDEDLWRRWIALFRERWPLAGDGPAAVFSAATYVSELGRRLGAEVVVVDPGRETVPISATLVREAPAQHLDHLAPPVRAWVESAWLT